MREQVGAIRLRREQHEVGEALGHHGGDLHEIGRAAFKATFEAPLMSQGRQAGVLPLLS